MSTFASLNAVSLTRPDAGQKLTVSVPSAARLEFAFDQSEGNIGRDGENLVLSFEDGATLTLEGFYDAFSPDKTPPVIVVQGQELPGEDFLAALGDPDLMPLAGPAGLTVGGGSYADSLLAGVGGVTRLGKLVFDADAPDPTEEPEVVEGVSDVAAAASGVTVFAAAATPATPEADPSNPPVAVVPPVAPPVEPPVVPPVAPQDYHTRLIAAASESGVFSFHAVDENGDLVLDGSRVAAGFGVKGAQGDYFTVLGVDLAGGAIRVELTELGRNALAQPAERVADMLTITLDGRPYVMPLMINDGPDYNDSAAQDALDKAVNSSLAGDLRAEWYAVEGRGLGGADVELGGRDYNRADVSNVGSGEWYGVAASGINVTASDAGDIRVVVRNTSSENNGAAYGLYSPAGEETILAGGSESRITVDASSAAGNTWAIYSAGAAADALVSVSGNEVALTSSTDSGKAVGILAGGASGHVSVTAGGAIDLSVTSRQGAFVGQNDASAIMSFSGADVTLRGSEISLAAASTNNGTYGVYAASGGAIKLAAEPGGTLDITAVTGNAPAAGGYGSVDHLAIISYGSGSRVNLTGGDITIEAVNNGAAGNSDGIYALAGGQANIAGYADQANVIDISGCGPQYARGLFATTDEEWMTAGINITGGAGNDSVSISGHSTDGYMGVGVGTATRGKITLEGGGQEAGGHDTLIVNALMEGAAHVAAGQGIYNMGSGAYGIVAAWGNGAEDGSASVLTSGFERVEINVTNAGAGGAFGMVCHDNPNYDVVANTIVNDSALELAINASALNDSDAYAMYANWGGRNIIQGGSRAGDEHGDDITLHGGVYANLGRNEITTGAGNDRVEIDGAIAGGNSIDLGAGDDLLLLDSAALSGLFLDGGADSAIRSHNGGAADNKAHLGDILGLGGETGGATEYFHSLFTSGGAAGITGFESLLTDIQTDHALDDLLDAFNELRAAGGLDAGTGKPVNNATSLIITGDTDKLLAGAVLSGADNIQEDVRVAGVGGDFTHYTINDYTSNNENIELHIYLQSLA